MQHRKTTQDTLRCNTVIDEVEPAETVIPQQDPGRTKSLPEEIQPENMGHEVQSKTKQDMKKMQSVSGVVPVVLPVIMIEDMEVTELTKHALSEEVEVSAIEKEEAQSTSSSSQIENTPVVDKKYIVDEEEPAEAVVHPGKTRTLDEIQPANEVQPETKQDKNKMQPVSEVTPVVLPVMSVEDIEVTKQTLPKGAVEVSVFEKKEAQSTYFSSNIEGMEPVTPLVEPHQEPEQSIEEIQCVVQNRSWSKMQHEANSMVVETSPEIHPLRRESNEANPAVVKPLNSEVNEMPYKIQHVEFQEESEQTSSIAKEIQCIQCSIQERTRTKKQNQTSPEVVKPLTREAEMSPKIQPEQTPSVTQSRSRTKTKKQYEASPEVLRPLIGEAKEMPPNIQHVEHQKKADQTSSVAKDIQCIIKERFRSKKQYEASPTSPTGTAKEMSPQFEFQKEPEAPSITEEVVELRSGSKKQYEASPTVLKPNENHDKELEQTFSVAKEVQKRSWSKKRYEKSPAVVKSLNTEAKDMPPKTQQVKFQREPAHTSCVAKEIQCIVQERTRSKKTGPAVVRPLIIKAKEMSPKIHHVGFQKEPEWNPSVNEEIQYIMQSRSRSKKQYEASPAVVKPNENHDKELEQTRSVAKEAQEKSWTKKRKENSSAAVKPLNRDTKVKPNKIQQLKFQKEPAQTSYVAIFQERTRSKKPSPVVVRPLIIREAKEKSPHVEFQKEHEQNPSVTVQSRSKSKKQYEASPAVVNSLTGKAKEMPPKIQDVEIQKEPEQVPYISEDLVESTSGSKKQYEASPAVVKPNGNHDKELEQKPSVAKEVQERSWSKKRTERHPAVVKPLNREAKVMPPKIQQPKFQREPAHTSCVAKEIQCIVQERTRSKKTGPAVVRPLIREAKEMSPNIQRVEFQKEPEQNPSVNEDIVQLRCRSKKQFEASPTVVKSLTGKAKETSSNIQQFEFQEPEQTPSITDEIMELRSGSKKQYEASFVVVKPNGKHDKELEQTLSVAKGVQERSWSKKQTERRPAVVKALIREAKVMPPKIQQEKKPAEESQRIVQERTRSKKTGPAVVKPLIGEAKVMPPKIQQEKKPAEESQRIVQERTRSKKTGPAVVKPLIGEAKVMPPKIQQEKKPAEESQRIVQERTRSKKTGPAVVKPLIGEAKGMSPKIQHVEFQKEPEQTPSVTENIQYNVQLRPRCKKQYEASVKPQHDKELEQTQSVAKEVQERSWSKKRNETSPAFVKPLNREAKETTPKFQQAKFQTAQTSYVVKEIQCIVQERSKKASPEGVQLMTRESKEMPPKIQHEFQKESEQTPSVSEEIQRIVQSRSQCKKQSEGSSAVVKPLIRETNEKHDKKPEQTPSVAKEIQWIRSWSKKQNKTRPAVVKPMIGEAPPKTQKHVEILKEPEQTPSAEEEVQHIMQSSNKQAKEMMPKSEDVELHREPEQTPFPEEEIQHITHSSSKQAKEMLPKSENVEIQKEPEHLPSIAEQKQRIMQSSNKLAEEMPPKKEHVEVQKEPEQTPSVEEELQHIMQLSNKQAKEMLPKNEHVEIQRESEQTPSVAEETQHIVQSSNNLAKEMPPKSEHVEIQREPVQTPSVEEVQHFMQSSRKQAKEMLPKRADGELQKKPEQTPSVEEEIQRIMQSSKKQAKEMPPQIEHVEIQREAEQTPSVAEETQHFMQSSYNLVEEMPPKKKHVEVQKEPKKTTSLEEEIQHIMQSSNKQAKEMLPKSEHVEVQKEPEQTPSVEEEIQQLSSKLVEEMLPKIEHVEEPEQTPSVAEEIMQSSNKQAQEMPLKIEHVEIQKEPEQTPSVAEEIHHSMQSSNKQAKEMPPKIERVEILKEPEQTSSLVEDISNKQVKEIPPKIEHIEILKEPEEIQQLSNKQAKEMPPQIEHVEFQREPEQTPSVAEKVRHVMQSSNKQAKEMPPKYGHVEIEKETEQTPSVAEDIMQSSNKEAKEMLPKIEHVEIQKESEQTPSVEEEMQHTMQSSNKQAKEMPLKSELVENQEEPASSAVVKPLIREASEKHVKFQKEVEVVVTSPEMDSLTNERHPKIQLVEFQEEPEQTPSVAEEIQCFTQEKLLSKKEQEVAVGTSPDICDLVRESKEMPPRIQHVELHEEPELASFVAEEMLQQIQTVEPVVGDNLPVEGMEMTKSKETLVEEMLKKLAKEDQLDPEQTLSVAEEALEMQTVVPDVLFVAVTEKTKPMLSEEKVLEETVRKLSKGELQKEPEQTSSVEEVVSVYEEATIKSMLCKDIGLEETMKKPSVTESEESQPSFVEGLTCEIELVEPQEDPEQIPSLHEEIQHEGSWSKNEYEEKPLVVVTSPEMDSLTNQRPPKIQLAEFQEEPEQTPSVAQEIQQEIQTMEPVVGDTLPVEGTKCKETVVEEMIKKLSKEDQLDPEQTLSVAEKALRMQTAMADVLFVKGIDVTEETKPMLSEEMVLEETVKNLSKEELQKEPEQTSSVAEEVRPIYEEATIKLMLSKDMGLEETTKNPSVTETGESQPSFVEGPKQTQSWSKKTKYAVVEQMSSEAEMLPLFEDTQAEIEREGDTLPMAVTEVTNPVLSKGIVLEQSTNKLTVIEKENAQLTCDNITSEIELLEPQEEPEQIPSEIQHVMGEGSWTKKQCEEKPPVVVTSPEMDSLTSEKLPKILLVEEPEQTPSDVAEEIQCFTQEKLLSKKEQEANFVAVGTSYIDDLLSESKEMPPQIQHVELHEEPELTLEPVVGDTLPVEGMEMTKSKETMVEEMLKKLSKEDQRDQLDSEQTLSVAEEALEMQTVVADVGEILFVEGIAVTEETKPMLSEEMVLEETVRKLSKEELPEQTSSVGEEVVPISEEATIKSMPTKDIGLEETMKTPSVTESEESQPSFVEGPKQTQSWSKKTKNAVVEQMPSEADMLHVFEDTQIEMERKGDTLPMVVTEVTKPVLSKGIVLQQSASKLAVIEKENAQLTCDNITSEVELLEPQETEQIPFECFTQEKLLSKKEQEANFVAVGTSYIDDLLRESEEMPPRIQHVQLHEEPELASLLAEEMLQEILTMEPVVGDTLPVEGMGMTKSKETMVEEMKLSKEDQLDPEQTLSLAEEALAVVADVGETLSSIAVTEEIKPMLSEEKVLEETLKEELKKEPEQMSSVSEEVGPIYEEATIKSMLSKDIGLEETMKKPSVTESGESEPSFVEGPEQIQSWSKKTKNAVVEQMPSEADMLPVSEDTQIDERETLPMAVTEVTNPVLSKGTVLQQSASKLTVIEKENAQLTCDNITSLLEPKETEQIPSEEIQCFTQEKLLSKKEQEANFVAVGTSYIDDLLRESEEMPPRIQHVELHELASFITEEMLQEILTMEPVVGDTLSVEGMEMTSKETVVEEMLKKLSKEDQFDPEQTLSVAEEALEMQTVVADVGETLFVNGIHVTEKTKPMLSEEVVLEETVRKLSKEELQKEPEQTSSVVEEVVPNYKEATIISMLSKDIGLEETIKKPYVTECGESQPSFVEGPKQTQSWSKKAVVEQMSSEADMLPLFEDTQIEIEHEGETLPMSVTEVTKPVLSKGIVLQQLASKLTVIEKENAQLTCDNITSLLEPKETEQIPSEEIQCFTQEKLLSKKEREANFVAVGTSYIDDLLRESEEMPPRIQHVELHELASFITEEMLQEILTMEPVVGDTLPVEGMGMTKSKETMVEEMKLSEEDQLDPEQTLSLAEEALAVVADVGETLSSIAVTEEIKPMLSEEKVLEETLKEELKKEPEQMSSVSEEVGPIYEEATIKSMLSKDIGLEETMKKPSVTEGGESQPSFVEDPEQTQSWSKKTKNAVVEQMPSEADMLPVSEDTQIEIERERETLPMAVTEVTNPVLSKGTQSASKLTVIEKENAQLTCDNITSLLEPKETEQIPSEEIQCFTQEKLLSKKEQEANFVAVGTSYIDDLLREMPPRIQHVELHELASFITEEMLQEILTMEPVVGDTLPVEGMEMTKSKETVVEEMLKKLSKEDQIDSEQTLSIAEEALEMQTVVADVGKTLFVDGIAVTEETKPMLSEEKVLEETVRILSKEELHKEPEQTSSEEVGPIYEEATIKFLLSKDTGLEGTTKKPSVTEIEESQPSFVEGPEQTHKKTKYAVVEQMPSEADMLPLFKDTQIEIEREGETLTEVTKPVLSKGIVLQQSASKLTVIEKENAQLTCDNVTSKIDLLEPQEEPEQIPSVREEIQHVMGEGSWTKTQCEEKPADLTNEKPPKIQLVEFQEEREQTTSVTEEIQCFTHEKLLSKKKQESEEMLPRIQHVELHELASFIAEEMLQEILTMEPVVGDTLPVEGMEMTKSKETVRKLSKEEQPEQTSSVAEEVRPIYEEATIKSMLSKDIGLEETTKKPSLTESEEAQPSFVEGPEQTQSVSVEFIMEERSWGKKSEYVVLEQMPSEAEMLPVFEDTQIEIDREGDTLPMAVTEVTNTVLSKGIVLEQLASKLTVIEKENAQLTCDYVTSEIELLEPQEEPEQIPSVYEEIQHVIGEGSWSKNQCEEKSLVVETAPEIEEVDLPIRENETLLPVVLQKEHQQMPSAGEERVHVFEGMKIEGKLPIIDTEDMVVTEVMKLDEKEITQTFEVVEPVNMETERTPSEIQFLQEAPFFKETDIEVERVVETTPELIEDMTDAEVTKPTLSEEANQTIKEPKPTLSEEADQTIKDTKSTVSEEANQMIKETKPTLSQMSKETKPTLSEEADQTIKETKPTLSEEADQTIKEPKPTLSEEANQTNKETKPTLSEEADQTIKETKPTLSEEADQPIKEPKPTLSEEADQTIKEPKPTLSEEADQTIKEPKPTLSEEANQTIKETKPTLSEEANQTIKDTMPTLSEKANQTIKETKPTVSEEANQTIKDTKPTLSEEANQMSKETKPTLSEEANQTIKDTKPTLSEKANQTIKETKPTVSEEANQTTKDTTLSEEANQMSKETKPTLSEEADQTIKETKPTLSEEADQTIKEPKPTLSEEADQMIKEPKPMLSEEANQTIKETKPTLFVEANQTNKETKPTLSEEANQTIKETLEKSILHETPSEIEGQGQIKESEQTPIEELQQMPEQIPPTMQHPDVTESLPVDGTKQILGLDSESEWTHTEMQEVCDEKIPPEIEPEPVPPVLQEMQQPESKSAIAETDEVLQALLAKWTPSVLEEMHPVVEEVLEMQCEGAVTNRAMEEILIDDTQSTVELVVGATEPLYQPRVREIRPTLEIVWPRQNPEREQLGVGEMQLENSNMRPTLEIIWPGQHSEHEQPVVEEPHKEIRPTLEIVWPRQHQETWLEMQPTSLPRQYPGHEVPGVEETHRRIRPTLEIIWPRQHTEQRVEQTQLEFGDMQSTSEIIWPRQHPQHEQPIIGETPRETQPTLEIIWPREQPDPEVLGVEETQLETHPSSEILWPEHIQAIVEETHREIQPTLEIVRPTQHPEPRVEKAQLEIQHTLETVCPTQHPERQQLIVAETKREVGPTLEIIWPRQHPEQHRHVRRRPTLEIIWPRQHPDHEANQVLQPIISERQDRFSHFEVVEQAELKAELDGIDESFHSLDQTASGQVEQGAKWIYQNALEDADYRVDKYVDEQFGMTGIQHTLTEQTKQEFELMHTATRGKSEVKSETRTMSVEDLTALINMEATRSSAQPTEQIQSGVEGTETLSEKSRHRL